MSATTPDLIPLMKVHHSIMIYDELELIKDPLYREERWKDVHNYSMAKHRDYVRRMLSYYMEIDEVQNWLMCLLAALYRRLESSLIISKGSAHAIVRAAWPESTNQNLQLYRENLMKLMM